MGAYVDRQKEQPKAPHYPDVDPGEYLAKQVSL